MTSRYEELLLPEQRDRIVGRVVSALKTQGQLPAKTLNDFRDLFRAGKPIPGFNNDPLRAMPPLLRQQLLERLEQNPDIEGLIVATWADTEPQLQEIVSEHIDSLDPQTYEGDDLNEDFWDRQVSLLMEKHGSHEEDDILLMTKVCYAHANLQASPEGEEAQHGTREPYSMEETLDAMLDSLRNVPAAFPQWRDSIPQFVESVEELIKEKNQELIHVRGLTSDLTHVQSVFQAELSFFRQQDEEWDAPILATFMAASQGVDGAAKSLSELKNALATYRRIKERADTLAEERERREQRHELEEVIEGILREIDEISRTAAVSDEADSADGEDAPEEPPEVDTVPLEELRALKEEQESLAVSNRGLQGEVAGLQADKQALTDEVAELRDQLRISEMNETNWRNAYEAGMSGGDSDAPEPIPAEVENVRRALDLARARYGDRLVLRLNKKSDPDYNYNRPKEVWDALDWLATTYHKAQTGEIRVIDLNESIRNTCGGWEYKPNQTDITLNTYREWYETTKDGKTYELRKHIAKGTGRDANSIRIAFEWDEDLERIIVGYVGPHQRTRGS